LVFEMGEHIAWYREWLYWYDGSGNRYLSASERAMEAEAIAERERLAKQEAEAIAERERSIANQERLAKQKAEEKAQQLAQRLRDLGIDPDEI